MAADSKTQERKGNFRFPNDGWSTEDEATATCFCGAVQLSFGLKEGLLSSFVCNCSDCHKVCQMQAWNFVADDKYVKWIRGEDKLSKFTTSKSIKSGNDMTNLFCSVCGTLMSRFSSGFPGKSFLRIGTVDDFALHDTLLRPQDELFIGDRCKWFSEVEGTKQWPGMASS